ncbi:MAG: sulfatase-like hydrolase/transferase, partial [Acidobacteriota bacterium]
MSNPARIALLLGLTLFASGCAKRPWNVLLITLDTTRADFIGCYGKASARTPNLDRLAAEGFLFEHAYSSNPVTQAAHSTILTGVYPMVHGVRDNGLFQLPQQRETLAEMLAARGYATGAAVGGFPLTRQFGTDQGFDFYDDDLTADRFDHRGRPAERQRQTWYDERPAAHVNDAILPWLRERTGEPFFVWLHYWDPHEPHIAPAPYGQLFAHDPYQGEIAYTDDSLGTILRQLESSGELERTLVVVTADHGESRSEHKELTHAFLAFDSTLHVPLILRVPERRGGRRIAQRAGTVDIVPTVLDLLGFEPPKSLQGRSLAPLMSAEQGVDDSADSNRRAYYAESLSPRLAHGFGELRVLLRGPWKYIHGPRPELYNLEDDPRELSDLSAERPEESQRFATALQEFLDLHASADAADATFEADEETRQRLAALGYLSTGGDDPGGVTEVLRDDGIAPQDRVGDINLIIRLRRQLSQGAFPLARRTAERLLELDPDNAFFRSKLVLAYLGLAQPQAAARVVAATETLSPTHLEDFMKVAPALYESGEPQQAIALARRLMSAGESADGQATLARMLSGTGDTAGFEAAIDRALELDPEHRGARLQRLRQLTASGRLEQGEPEAKRLLAAYPADFEGHLAYARLLAADQRPTEALVSIERSLRFAPRFCDAHLERIRVLLELRRADDLDGAMAELTERCNDPE